MNSTQTENKFKFEDTRKGGDGRALSQESIDFMVREFRKMGLSHEDTKDAAADTAIVVWKKASTFSESKGRFDNWIFGIMRNVFLRYYLKQAKRFKLEVPIDGDEGHANLSVETPSSQINESAPEFLRKYGKRLNAAEKEVLNTRFLGNSENSVTEAAGYLGWTEGKVRMRTLRAMESLRAAILAYGKERGCLEHLPLKEKAVLQMKADPKPFNEEPIVTEIEDEIANLKSLDQRECNTVYLRALQHVFLCLNSD
jgi:RNA polymerase sigma factor (sigma-70 family)